MRIMILLCFFVFILQGCYNEHNEDSLSKNNESVKPTIVARSSSFTLLHDESIEFNLKEHNLVAISDGSEFYVSNVEPIANFEACNDISWQNNSISINAPSLSQVCRYRYSVIANNNPKDEKVSVLSAIVLADSYSDTNREYPNISEIVLLDSEGVTIDLKAKIYSDLGEAVPLEWSLSSIIIPAFPTDAKIENISPTGSFLYKPPSSNSDSGVEHWMYNFVDAENNVTKAGVISFILAENANQGLTIKDTNGTLNKIEWSAPLDITKTNEIDISKYVTSLDGDDYQVYLVDSFYANVGVKDRLNPDNPKTNKIITFETTQAGEHYVSFSVGDNRGSYATGLIKVFVADLDLINVWENVTNYFREYIAPITQYEADLLNVKYSNLLKETYKGKEYTIISFNDPTHAELHCQQKGGIPTPQDILNEIIGEHDNWPNGWPYLTYDPSQSKYRLVNLRDSSISDYDVNDSKYNTFYTTCKVNGGLNAVKVKTKAAADGIDVAIIQFTALKHGIALSSDDFELTLEKFYGGLSNDSETHAVFDKDIYEPNENGMFEVKIKNTKLEGVNVKLKLKDTSDGEKSITPYVFFGELDTAKLVTSNIVNDGGTTESSNDIKENEVKFRLLDNNSNPVPEQLVTITFSEMPHEYNYYYDNVSGTHPTVNNVNNSYSLINKSSENTLKLLSDKDGYVSVKLINSDTERLKVVANYESFPHHLLYPTGQPNEEVILRWCNINKLPLPSVNSHTRNHNFSPPLPAWVQQACKLPEFGIVTDGGHLTEISVPSGIGSFDIMLGVRSEANRWCQKLNEIKHEGYSNWEVPSTRALLMDIYVTNGNMWTNYGWPVRYPSWTNEEYWWQYYVVRLADGYSFNNVAIPQTEPNNMTCLSKR